MSEKVRRRFSPDPTKAAVTLRWKVVAGADGELAVEKKTTTPPSRTNESGSALVTALSDLGITLVPGSYVLRYSINDGMSALVLPKGLDHASRGKLFGAFARILSRMASDLSSQLSSFPTEPDVTEAADIAMQTVIRLLIQPESKGPKLAAVGDLSHVRPGFVRVSGVDCVECSVKKALTDKKTNRTWAVFFGDNDRGIAMIEVNGGTAEIRVGYVSCSTAFAQYLNDLLARRFKEILDGNIGSIAAEASVRNVFEHYASGVRAFHQIAAGFGFSLADQPAPTPVPEVPAQVAAPAEPAPSAEPTVETGPSAFLATAEK